MTKNALQRSRASVGRLWAMAPTVPTCVLCETNPSTRRGEHVLPQWYLSDLDVIGPPPFAWSKGKEPLRGRTGTPIRRSERVRVLLPTCRPCNAELDRRFEKPARDPLRRLFAARGNIRLSHDEAKAVGLWLTKTLLLTAHPAVRYGDASIDPHAMRWDLEECPPQRFFSWLVTGDEPPEGVSLWLHRTDEKAEDPGATEHVMPLPTVTADGEVTDFVCFHTSFHGIHVSLVVHPGWPIVHPLEEDGRALRLLPASGAKDLSALPVLDRRTVRWLRCRVSLRDGSLGSGDLPPLTASGFALPVVLGPHVVRCSY